MNPIFTAAAEIQSFCRAREWRFCFIGGLAVQRWGEPRFTQDVDLTLLTGFGAEEPFVDALLGTFRPRIAGARTFALRNRVLLLASSAGVPIDLTLGAMPFEESAIDRATDFRVAPGTALTTCSAEDLIVFKAFAGRERDWLDIAGIAARSLPGLDVHLVWRELLPLLELKEDRNSEARLRLLLAEG